MNSVPVTASPDQLGDVLAQAWDAFVDSVSLASRIWNDRVLEPEGDSGEPWSARLAAWHAVAGERIRNAYIEYVLASRPSDPIDMMAFAASGAAGDVSVNALREQYRQTRTPADMSEAVQRTRAASEDLLTRVDESSLRQRAKLTDFVQDYLQKHGQVPTPDVRGILLHGAVHLSDHARQIARAAHA